jgi:hypothetical protein
MDNESFARDYRSQKNHCYGYKIELTSIISIFVGFSHPYIIVHHINFEPTLNIVTIFIVIFIEHHTLTRRQLIVKHFH